MCVGPMLAGYHSAWAGEALWAAKRVMIGLDAAGSLGQMNNGTGFWTAWALTAFFRPVAMVRFRESATLPSSAYGIIDTAQFGPVGVQHTPVPNGNRFLT